MGIDTPGVGPRTQLAGTTLPSTTESARKPPLAQPAFHCLSKANRCSSPRTCSRRNGAAWETAIRVTPLAEQLTAVPRKLWGT